MGVPKCLDHCVWSTLFRGPTVHPGVGLTEPPLATFSLAIPYPEDAIDVLGLGGVVNNLQRISTNLHLPFAELLPGRVV